MPELQILIVDGDTGRVRELTNSIIEVGLPAPHHRKEGENAVLWIGANQCDLCIMSYELPTIDGLEAMARMRTRRPDLPVVMIASSQEQHVAVAAFRAGVVDFVPAHGSFARIVAERVLAQLDPENRAQQTMVQAMEDPSLRHVPKERLRPTYQNRLRTIGLQLDLYKYYSITVLEVMGGFIVRANVQRGRRPTILEFADSDFPRLVGQSISDGWTGANASATDSPLCPTGYEDLLRAIGFRLDHIAAESILLAELKDAIAIGGRGNDETGAVPGIVPFQMFLTPPDIEYMLNEAFHRRGSPVPEPPPTQKDPGKIRNILRRLN